MLEFDLFTICTSLALRRWLIAIAFWLSKGFIKSGLGNRIAYSIVSLFGKTTLGLTYSLVMAEALLAPAIPSVAARAGGIFFPLAQVETSLLLLLLLLRVNDDHVPLLAATIAVCGQNVQRSICRRGCCCHVHTTWIIPRSRCAWRAGATRRTAPSASWARTS